MKVKIFFYLDILHCTGFLLILITTLRDEYIDRPNLTEQKKTLFEFVILLPAKVDQKKMPQKYDKKYVSKSDFLGCCTKKCCLP